MSETMEKYINIAVRKEHIERIRSLLEKGCGKEFILSVGYTEDEFQEAEAGGFVVEESPHTVESELAEALFRLSFGKLTYEQAAEKAKEAAPKFDVNDKMLAYKGISWYAKELLKKM